MKGTGSIAVSIGLLVAGCAEQDGFGAKVARGCSTPFECSQLVDEAQARVGKCRPNTIGFIDCREAESDLSRARMMASRHEDEEEQARLDRERRKNDEERAAFRAEREQKKAEEVRDRKAQQAIADDWNELHPAMCSTQVDDDACAALQAFIDKYPDSDQASEAKRFLENGKRAKVEREKQAAEEKTERRQAAAAAEAAKNAPKPKHAKCCDGSVDASCGPSGGAGCCFRRGGVCGSE